MTIRVPKSLRERLDKAAERDRRLVSDYIVVTLEDAVAASEAAAAAAAAKKGR
jgi:predicted transcriptional regulator